PSQEASKAELPGQCGCGLTVPSCNHLNCGSGEPMKKEIAERIARGESKDQILAAFTARYGEKVLSAPTFRGFNWLAWLTPFAAGRAARARLVGVIPPPPPPPAAPPPAARRARRAAGRGGPPAAGRGGGAPGPPAARARAARPGVAAGDGPRHPRDLRAGRGARAPGVVLRRVAALPPAGAGAGG